ncbi:MAG: isocitrate lyase [Acidobacteria bacterium]|nr:isocitrate lyase [Acidobacteriota bacterium]
MTARSMPAKVAEVEREWERQHAKGRHIRRLHRAEQVAALRLVIHARHAVQNAMAWKLYGILRRHQQDGTSLNTFGPFDEASLDAMVRAGVPAIYIGGWAESARSGASDQARYAYTYLGETVSRFSRFLQQKARHNPELENQLLAPFFVDIDTGHLAPKELVEYLMTHGSDEPLVGAVHIEDQAHGCKKCGHMSGKVLVSTEEQIKRLNEVRLQLDVMGLDTLLVARTDAEAAEWVTSNLDARDHPFILGATNFRAGGYHQAIQEARQRGASEGEVEKIHRQWKKDAGVMTLGEAVARVMEQAQDKGQSLGMSTEQWRDFAGSASNPAAREKAEALGIRVFSFQEWSVLSKINYPFPATSVFWDWDLARTEELGYMLYMVQSGIAMAIARSQAFLPYADISWMEQHRPSLEQVRQWACALMEHARELEMPQPLLANNTSPSFYWRAEHNGNSLTDTQLRNFLREQAKAGIQFQFITYGGSQLDHYGVQRFLEGAEGFLEQGMLAWANFQDQALQQGNVFVQHSQEWAGVKWNTARDAAGRGASVTSPTGERDTMRQFIGGKTGARNPQASRTEASKDLLPELGPYSSEPQPAPLEPTEAAHF